MHALTQITPHGNRRQVNVRGGLALVGVLLGVLAARVNGETGGACPWEVQPLKRYSVYLNVPSFEIIYYGGDRDRRIFYGFSIPSEAIELDLNISQLADLNARRLQPLPAAARPQAYVVTAAVNEPVTLYLVSATSKIMALEQLNARIQPAKPKAERGVTDDSGPLPPQALPIVPVRRPGGFPAPNFQICASHIQVGIPPARQ